MGSTSTINNGASLVLGWFSKKDDIGRMVRAVRKGDLAAVQAMLAQGFDPDSTSPLRFPLLVEAAREGHLEVEKALIAAGANVNLLCGITALHAAARGGSVEMVRLLLESGAVVNRPDDSYTTPLMSAAAAGYPAIVELLLAAGADVGLVDEWGNSAIHAVGSPECARLLIKAGCNPSVRNRKGETPLAMAEELWFLYDREVAYELIAGGASLDSYSVTSTDGSTTKCEYKLNIQDKLGMTVLMVAAGRGNAEVVRKLLAKKVDLNKTNKDGKTALQLAQAAGHGEVVRLLEGAGAR